MSDKSTPATDPAWLAVRAFHETHQESPSAEMPGEPSATVIEREHPTTVADWSTLKTGAPPKLAAWPGMAPHLVNGDACEFDKNTRHGRGLWAAIALVTLAIGALLAALITESERSRLRTLALLPPPPPIAFPVTPTPAQPSAVTSKPAPPPAPSESAIRATTEMGTKLITALFLAKDSDSRVACVSDGERYRAEIDVYFSTLRKPAELSSFRPLGTPVRVLPGNESVMLCELTTNLSSQGTAITRLKTDSAGHAKLDWPLLRDSLQSALTEYAKNPSPSPQWVTVALRRNFGFDESAGVRAGYFVFDLQTTGDGADHTVALASKSSPIGRALERALAWNELYVVRLLLHWATVDERSRLTVLEADLTPTDGSSP